MKVSLESPATDLDLLIFIIMRAKPKVCTVPARVKIKENSPSLKKKYVMIMITAKIPQAIPSAFFIYYITWKRLLIRLQSFVNIFHQAYNLSMKSASDFKYFQRTLLLYLLNSKRPLY